MKYYFNWNQLLKVGQYKNDAILILTYSLVRDYRYSKSKKVASNSTELREKLKINSIPAFLFHKRVLRISAEYYDILCSFDCKDPQAYFLNKSFLFANYSSADKVNYLYALSQRNIATNEPQIPKNYLDKNRWNNPMLREKGDFLEFLPEIRLLNGGK